MKLFDVINFGKNCLLKYGKEAINQTRQEIHDNMIDMQRGAQESLTPENNKKENSDFEER